MAAPSKSFTIIADSAVDPDSPLTTTLATAWRDNDIHLEEWLGGSFVAAVDHKHDGVDSATIAFSDITGTPTLTLLSFQIDLSTSGTTASSTGALGFTPIACTVVGFLAGSGANPDTTFVGVATGTGSLAGSQSTRTDGTDAGAHDGAAVGVNLAGTRLEITTFGASEIVFTPTASVGTWTFTVLVWGQ